MTAITHFEARPRFTGPDALTLSRVPLAVAIAWVAFGTDPPARAVLVALFSIAIATDVIDGWWARRLGTAGRRGAALDSIADEALAVAVALAATRTIEWSVAPWAWWAIAAVAALRLAVLGVTLVRFRVVSIAHTWANKASGILIAGVALTSLSSGHLSNAPVAAAVGVATLAAVEEFLMTANARAYSRDRRGLWDDGQRTAPRFRYRSSARRG